MSESFYETFNKVRPIVEAQLTEYNYDESVKLTQEMSKGVWCKAEAKLAVDKMCQRRNITPVHSAIRS